MTVVVTGASGHIGANLTRELLARGRKVRALIFEGSRSLEGLPIERVKGDVRDISSLREAFRGADVVYHLAAKIVLVEDIKEEEVFSINVDGPKNVCQAAKECGVRRVVHFSSIHAFDDQPLTSPIDEGRPPARGAGFPLYDRSKAAGQRVVKEAAQNGLNVVIVNPTGVIGPNDYEPSAMGRVFLDLYHGQMPALVDGGFDFVDVRDVVAGALAAEEKGRSGECYLLSGRWTSVVNLARMASEITGKRAPRFVSPMWLAQYSAPLIVAVSKLLKRAPLYTPVSLRALRSNPHITNAKARRELGYSTRPIQDSIRDIYEWFRANGFLSK